MAITSKYISERFGKRHTQVMDLIKERVEEGSIEAGWVEKTTYKGGRKEEPMYNLNQRAVIEIVGGFTGKANRLERKRLLDEILNQ